MTDRILAKSRWLGKISVFFLIPALPAMRVPFTVICSVRVVLWWIVEQKQPPKMLYKQGVPKNFEKKLIGKHLCQSLFFNKVASLRF